MGQNKFLDRASLAGRGLGTLIFTLFFVGAGVTFGQNLNRLNPDSSQVEVPTASLSDSFEIVNLGANINTKYGDYRPRITTDGSTLYFCRRVGDESARREFTSLVGLSLEEFLELPDYQQKGKIQKATSNMDFAERLDFILMVQKIDGNEDIYESHFMDNAWTPAEPMGSELNTSENHEAPESISTDNNQFFIFKNGDVYLTKREGEQWGAMEKIPEPINSDSWDGDICFSSDGVTLFFVSKRPGFTTSYVDTAKNHDIWVSVKNEFGWGEPVNLGATINTPQAERTPFFHSDGRTLYFASDGHGGKGGLDLFKTTRIGDSTWTDWTEPVNLARLNTTGDDWDLTMPANSIWGYFSSKQQTGFGQDDIYQFRVDDSIAPQRKVTLITGVVTSTDGEPLEVEIRWEDLETGNFIGMATSNKKTGKYTIALPAGRLYGYYATMENYWDKSERIDLTDLLNYQELRVDIQLHRIAPLPDSDPDTVQVAGEIAEPTGGPPIPLTNIFFAFDQYTLDKKSYSELNRLTEKLLKNPQVNIQIEGHTDDFGTKAYNDTLSQRRADAVRAYLVARGVEPTRLIAIGFGESRPVDTNTTEEGREKNRRVQFIQLSAITRK